MPKTSEGTGAGVYKWGSIKGCSFSLGVHSMVFEVEIYAIKACIMENIEKGYKGRNIIPLTPNDPYSGHTALLTSKRCILYIYSTNIGTEYFKHDIYSLFFSLQNAVCFIILTPNKPVM